MKLLVALCLIAVVAAAPPSSVYYPSKEVSILQYNTDFTYPNYSYKFKQSDGTEAEQYGQFKNEGTKEESLAVTGRFQWVAPNGVTYTVTYTAGEDGYQPEVEEGPGGPPPGAYAASLLG